MNKQNLTLLRPLLIAMAFFVAMVTGHTQSVPRQPLKDVSAWGAASTATATKNVSAFTSAVSGGGWVVVSRPGTYYLNAAVTLPSNTRLDIGPGVIVAPASGYSGTLFKSAAGARGIIIQSFGVIQGRTEIHSDGKYPYTPRGAVFDVVGFGQVYKNYTGDVTAPADTNAIRDWRDISGNGFHFQQTTTANMPLYDGTLNLSPGLAFTGSADSGNGHKMASVSGKTVAALGTGTGFTVFLSLNSAPQSGLKVAIGAASTGFFIAQNTTGTFQWSAGGITKSGGGNFTIDLGTFANGNDHQLAFRYDSLTNKVTMFNGAAKVGDWACTGTLALGTAAITLGNATSGGNFAWTGGMLRATGCSVALSDNEIIQFNVANGQMARLTKSVFVADGNSLVSGYASFNNGGTNDIVNQLKALMGSLWDNVDVINRGVSGQTGAQMLADFHNTLDVTRGFGQAANSVVFLWEGTNTLFLGGNATTAANDVIACMDAALAAGNQVIVGTILPRTEAGTPGSFEADRQSANALIRAAVAARPGAYLVDFGASTSVIGAVGASDSTTHFNADKVHLNPDGYAVAARMLADVVSQIWKKATFASFQEAVAFYGGRNYAYVY